ncbi:MAG: hypothetical protein IPN66_13625 [Candidatus Competibacteraceae bacterium]|nr:hypothetical protein [Candidatus Competibacteraceae bacterium]
MDTDEYKVNQYLEERGFTVERFSKAEIRAGKTPDFRVFQNGKFLFYCEVKSSPEDRWLDEQLNSAAPGELVGGARNDPIFNRLSADIQKAMQQFDAVNKDQKHPNVLALVNHDDMCGFNDLLGILTGNFYANDGTIHPIYRRFSHGRIKDKKGKVHLFIWLDDHKPDRLLFSQTEETHHAVLCAAFGIVQNEIKQISQ